jgi:hypothetical protein
MKKIATLSVLIVATAFGAGAAGALGCSGEQATLRRNGRVLLQVFGE